MFNDTSWIDEFLSKMSGRKPPGQPIQVCGVWLCRDGRYFVHKEDAEQHTVRLGMGIGRD